MPLYPSENGKDPFLSTSYSPSYVEVDDDPKEVEYLEIKVKSALHHTSLPYSPKPFYYSLNLYRGCRHGCPYCFARYSHWFLGFQNSFDFQRKIQVKVNIAEVLDQELSRKSGKKDWITLGAITDPYQPAEKKYGLARKTFEVIARHRWPAVFSSKSDLVLRDLDVLKRVHDNAGAAVAMTITTLDPALQKFLEPHAVPVQRRLEALRQLKAAGIPCGIHLMPIIPFVTDTDEALEAMVKVAVELKVDYFVHNVLRLRGSVVRGYYFQSLKTHRKDLFQRTWQLYGKRSYPTDEYVGELRNRMNALKEKWGYQSRWRDLFPQRQLSLFD